MPVPFEEFARGVRPQGALRARITAAYRQSEPECVAALLAGASLPPTEAQAAKALARELVVALRQKKADSGGGVAGLIHEYSLSSQEGVALIRDKISTADWQSHPGHSS